MNRLIAHVLIPTPAGLLLIRRNAGLHQGRSLETVSFWLRSRAHYGEKEADRTPR